MAICTTSTPRRNPNFPTIRKSAIRNSSNFRKNFGQRGVIHSFANADGTQKIEDTGPLTKKRMETIDDDIAARAVEFLDKQVQANKPVFLRVNFTHMHFRTHTKPESLCQAGRWLGSYADTMIDHDKNVGTVLAKLKELGIEDNTIVMYSTDNGPHTNSWPDAAMTPFRNEKNSNWEGAYRCRLWSVGRARSNQAAY
jgi:arylsulfatase A-like enzyme